MANLYLTEQGAKITRRGDRLVVRSPDNEELLEIECRHLDTVLIFGNVQFTTQAAAEMLDHDIEFALLTRSGRLRGQLTPPRPRNIRLRLKQYEMSVAPSGKSLRLEIAQTLVLSKIRSAADVLNASLHNHPDEGLRAALKELQAAAEKTRQVSDHASLLGVEGSSARLYFENLERCCRGELAMKGRTSRPPRDPMNALLSFGYTLLGNELLSLLDAVGLDPYLGVYHRPRHGRPALALDLLEELRHPCVDRLALRLNNLGILKNADFQEQVDLPPRKRGWRLTRPALKRFLKEWDKWLNQPCKSAPHLRELSWRHVMRLQVERLARTVRDGKPYRPFTQPDSLDAANAKDGGAPE